MFAKRNSITLAALWLILLIIGVFWYINDTRSLVAMMKDQVELSSALKESQKEIKRLVTIEKKHSELNDRWLISEKKIISADEPAFSLSYLNWIMSRNNLPIDFDFTLNSKHMSFYLLPVVFASIAALLPLNISYKYIPHTQYATISG